MERPDEVRQPCLMVECRNPRMQGYGGPSWGPDCLIHVWLGPVGSARIPCARMPTTAAQTRAWRPLFVLPVDRALRHASLEVEVVRHNVVADVGTSSRQLLVGRGTLRNVGKCLARTAETTVVGRLDLHRWIGDRPWLEGSVDMSIWLADLPFH